MVALEDDVYGEFIRQRGLYPARECPECPRLQYMGLCLAPDPGDSGYVCPVCNGFYILEKRKGKKETLKRIGTVVIERMKW